jgi:DNA-binding Lrp family transcriptional regulator
MSEKIDEKRILSVIQEPLELVSEPFEKFAKKLDTDVETVLRAIKNLIERGIIRRFAGIIKHNKAGFTYNAMVAFEVGDDCCDDAGAKLSSLTYVTHCYKRTPYDDWPYNLYAMMHARDADEFDEKIAAMKRLFTFKSVTVLQSVKEFKKSHYLINTK